MMSEKPNNFTIDLTMKDAVLENISNVYFNDGHVTNFSKKLGAGNKMLGSSESWGEEIYTWGQKLPEKIQLRSKNWTYNGYAWGMTDENGYLYIHRERVDLTLTVKGSNIKRVIVYGDRTAKQWATEAYLDGDPDNKIYSDDGVWAIQWSFPSDTHSVTFTRWNRAKYPACIIHVRRFGDTMYCGIVTTKRWEWLTQITPRPKEYYYGVTPGRGEVVLWARKELKDYIEDGILTSDMLSVRIKNNDETVVIRSVSDSEYDMSSKLLTLELSDCLSSWGKRKYPGRGLTEEMSAFDLMAEVLSGLKYTVDDVEKMCTKTIPVGTEGEEMTVARYLKGIRIPYPYLEPDTYRATIEKFCRLAQICCYADDNNFPVFVSGRPVMLKAERERPIYDIPKSHQFGPVRKSVIKKNKVKRVEVEVLDIKEEFGNIGESVYINYYELRTDVDESGDVTNSTIRAYQNPNLNEFSENTIIRRISIDTSVDEKCFITSDIKIPIQSSLIKDSDIENAKLNCQYNITRFKYKLENDKQIISERPTYNRNVTNVEVGSLVDTRTKFIVCNNKSYRNKMFKFDFYAYSNQAQQFYTILNARLQMKGINRTSKTIVKTYSEMPD